MQFQKFLAVLCVATFSGAAVSQIHSADNDAQARAREALRQAMLAPATNTTPVAAATPKAPAVAPKPAAAAPLAAPAKPVVKISAPPTATAPVVKATAPVAKPVAAPAADTTYVAPVAPITKPGKNVPDSEVRARMLQRFSELDAQAAAGKDPYALHAMDTNKMEYDRTTTAPAKSEPMPMEHMDHAKKEAAAPKVSAAAPVKTAVATPAAAAPAPMVSKGTSADEAMRERVRQAIADLNAKDAAAKGQPVKTVSTPAPVAPPKAPVAPTPVKPAPVPAPVVVKAPAPVAPMAPAKPVVAMDAPVPAKVVTGPAISKGTSADEAMRERVRKTIAELNAKDGTSKPGEEAKKAEADKLAAAAAAKKAEMAKMEQAKKLEAAKKAEADKLAAAKKAESDKAAAATAAAVAAKKATEAKKLEAAKVVAAPATKPVVKEVKKEEKKAVKPAAAPAAPAVVKAPAASVVNSKQAKLDNLDQQYKADKIGPAEYHQRRADLLAQP